LGILFSESARDSIFVGLAATFSLRSAPTRELYECSETLSIPQNPNNGMTAKRSKRRDRRALARADARVAKPGSANARRTLSLASGSAISVALLLLVGFIYSPVGDYQFISLDDPQYVSANPMVLSGFTYAGVRQAFALHGSFYWHPLTWMSHMLDVQLFGVDPGAHHAINALLHGINTVLLFFALRSMTRSDIRSAFVAALFAVHPLHVESVAWISERKDVLSTMFWMVSMLAYAQYVRDPRLIRKLLLIVLFALGLLAKPMILTLPFVLLLLDYWPLRRFELSSPEKGRMLIRLVVEKAPLFALSVASLAVTMISQRGSSAVVSMDSLSLGTRVGNSLVSYVLYLRDMVWPGRLAAFYPFAAPSILEVAIATAILLVLTGIAIRFARSLPYIAVGWLWYLGVLVPVIGLVQAGNQGRADRFTYVAIVGIFVALVWGAGDLAKRYRGVAAPATIAGVAIVIAFAGAARIQLGYWKDDIAVWGRAVSVTTENYRAENHYGVALTNRGMNPEGIEHYLAALRIWPDYPEAHNNLGTARMEQQQIDAAIHEFSEAARIRPNMATYHYNLGVALSTKGDTASALREVRKAHELDPANRQFSDAVKLLGG
jgi:Flp pilus assembly protein TadD